MLFRAAFFLMIAFAAATAENFRLYLKDGTFQITNEYKIQKDRLSYYSTEREEWEDVPLNLVDLDRTRKEIAQHEAELKADAKAQAEEDAAERNAAKQVEQIPPEPGVYYIHGDKLETIKVAESKIVNNKRRQTLKILSPVPLVSGKSTLEIDGDTSSNEVAEKRPEFYFHLSDFERFGIISLTPTKKGSRVVENITIVPVSKEFVQKFQEVETFKKQEGDNIYKIWPQKDMEPGEYALVEYTEGLDTINTQVWDFKIVNK
jgi:hypothetical protein